MLSMRLLSGVVFFILFFVALFAPHMQFLMILLLAFGALMGVHEFIYLGREKPPKWLIWLTLASAVAMLVTAYFLHYEYMFIVIGMAAVLGLGIITFTQDANPGDLVSRSLASLIYVALPLSLLMAIWQTFRVRGADSSEHYIIFLVLVTWSSDTGAYFIGRMFGRHKMCPGISPGKTWEGMAGGVAMTIGVAVLMKLFWNNIDRIFSWPAVIALSLIFSLVAPWGDLAESRLKRGIGVKDSGQTFTGHGGMLDIIDSLLFTTIVFYAYLKLFRDFSLF
ncbi:phosphatidate cytidylyltransferase [bacterium]|nr:phosphatidate cytidylyltransferase [bacterium]